MNWTKLYIVQMENALFNRSQANLLFYSHHELIISLLQIAFGTIERFVVVESILNRLFCILVECAVCTVKYDQISRPRAIQCKYYFTNQTVMRCADR